MKRLCILLTSILTLVAGQAPGDEAGLCTVTLPGVGQNVFVDPPNEVPLMDTSHYQFLLNTNPVWQRLNLDDNNPPGAASAWAEQGTVCETELTVCGFTAGSQNNWLITQHINTTLDNGDRLRQVTMQVTYIQNMCPEGGASACQRVFDVYKYETSTIDSITASNTSYYTREGGLTTNEAFEKQTVSLNIDLSTNESGFYLAIVDTGTCIVISRLVVFYYICPNETVDLVARPRTLAPPVGTPPLQGVPADCVENARPASGGSLTLTCLSQGKWLDSTSGCVCNPGFTLSQNGQCITCPPGSYARVATGVCEICPNNSNSTEPGVAECPCFEGFYRTPQEIDLPCTQPPSPPLNLRITGMTSTTISLEWDEPLFTGGRNRTEFRYALWHQAAGTDVPIRFGTVQTTNGMITGLEPGVDYLVYVTSETNITGQISVNSTLLMQRGVTAPVTTEVAGGVSPGLIVGIVVIVLVLVGVLVAVIVVLFICYTKQKRVVKETISAYAPIELPKVGRKMYVDPTTYANPDEAVKDFATEMAPREFRMTEEIGAGEFGNVYKGIWKSQGKQIPIAVKTLRSGSSSKLKNDFLFEASIMGQFDHPHVIKLYGVVTRVEPAMIVMEFMENGSLYHYLRKNDDKLSVERQVKMARSVASGMDYLSTVGFVHRDLAARNVLIGKNEVCKVADFGLSRETVDDEYDVKKGGKIPVRWTAPEAIFRRRFTSASDVWSYGILLWEIMSYGQNPYDDWDNQTVLDRVENGYRLEKPDECPQSVYQLMLNCWHSEKNDRPKFDEIVTYIDQLIENKMEASLPNPAPAQKPAPKYFSSAHVLNPLDYKSLEEWLKAIKMERYLDMFENNGFQDINQVLRLTEADLREMGITLAGHLFKITTSIDKGQAQVGRQPSLKV